MPEIKHECGLFGVYGCLDAPEKVYYGLYSLQHRGEESAGIASAAGSRIVSHKGMGLVSNVFKPQDLTRLRSQAAIGHVRYSTIGASEWHNAQPFVGEYSKGQVAIAHNGQLVNAKSLRMSLEKAGAVFHTQTTSDSEVILHLMAKPEYRNNLPGLLGDLKGAFSLLILTPEEMIAARDLNGFRPLCIGRLNDGYVVASESCALEQIGATYLREVSPGELIYIDKNGLRSETFAPARPSYCIFELIYFSRPDSVIFGENVHLFRKSLGEKLAEECPVEADIVISVPEGGNSAAMGYSQASGIPLERGFVRNHYVGRTFIQPGVQQRRQKAEIKLNAIAPVVAGKRVVVVDDSIVRGTTSKSRFGLLKRSGAKEIHVRISCPPHRFPCYYGIDFQIKEELIAAVRSLEEITEYLEVDSLGYLSIEGLLSCTSAPKDYCVACFAGKYPVPTEITKKAPEDSEEWEERTGEHIIVV
ncbi:MAG: amidophosphoribosyltransferase [Candidatus Brocadiales bacterium]